MDYESLAEKILYSMRSPAEWTPDSFLEAKELFMFALCFAKHEVLDMVEDPIVKEALQRQLESCGYNEKNNIQCNKSLFN